MKRVFEDWLKSMRKSIADYKYYIDFNSVYKNAEKYKVELNILNSLIGSKDIENEFKTLLNKYPEILNAIPILIAKRETEIFCMDAHHTINYDFSKKSQTPEEYCYFMKETGLFELIEHHIINNLFDYVLGVETGLNSNGRKNRGGDLMENLVESFIRKMGFEKDVNYYKELYSFELEVMSGIKLVSDSKEEKADKRFDFVINNNDHYYAIECNFYSSQGSKLNETARSYKNIALETKDIDKFTFIWITDGLGWNTAKNNLKETFEVLDTIYNIKDLEDGELEKLIKGDRS